MPLPGSGGLSRRHRVVRSQMFDTPSVTLLCQIQARRVSSAPGKVHALAPMGMSAVDLGPSSCPLSDSSITPDMLTDHSSAGTGADHLYSHCGE